MQEIAALRARNPRAFGKTIADLTVRGFRPTETALVIRSMRLVNNVWVPSRTEAPFKRAQYEDFYDSSQGEVAFWSWDDGDNSTWEGTIYCENYTNGVVDQFDDQADVTTDSPAVMWEDLVYDERPGGGGPQQVVNRFGTSSTAFNSQYQRLRVSDRASSPYERVRLSDRDYLGCVIGGLIGVAIGCTFLGPGWLPCFVAGATVVVFQCLIQRIV